MTSPASGSRCCVVELAIELRARVDDAPVDRRTHRDGGRPVLGGQRQFQRAQMHVVHRNQASLLERTAPPLAVFEADAFATACRAEDRAPGDRTGA